MTLFESILQAIGKIFTGTVERPSPSNIIPSMTALFQPGSIYAGPDGRTRLKKDLVIIPFNEDPVIWMAGIPDTNSEDPLFDIGHELLYVQGTTPDEQQIMVDWLANEFENKRMANLIAAKTPYVYAIHRVIKIDYDSAGRKWKFEGDNNPTADNGWARDSGIQWLCAAIVY